MEPVVPLEMAVLLRPESAPAGEGSISCLRLSPLEQDPESVLPWVTQGGTTSKLLRREGEGYLPSPCPGLDAEFCHVSRRTYPNPPQGIQNNIKGGNPSKLYEANNTLISKWDRDTTEKENYRLISLVNINDEIFNKVLAKRLQQHIRHSQEQFIPGTQHLQISKCDTPHQPNQKMKPYDHFNRCREDIW